MVIGSTRRALLGRVLVGYDDSPESVLALQAARASRAPVRLEDSGALGGRDPEGSGGDATSGRLGDVDVTGHLRRPREGLAQFAKNLDLLVVGSRSYGPLGRLVHGSVSGYLLGHAACSLLVLPRAAKLANSAH